MKIKDGFVLRAVADSNIVVPLGNQISSFGSIIKLSDTGAFLWKKLENDSTVDELVCALVDEYDVDTATATCDVDKFIRKLSDCSLLEK